MATVYLSERAAITTPENGSVVLYAKPDGEPYAKNSDGVEFPLNTPPPPLVTTTTNGLMSAPDKVKLDGVESLATKNATDVALRDRATHTGAQPSSTITGFNSEVDSRSDARIALQKGAVSGICPIGLDQKVSSVYLPSYVDDVLEFANLAAFPGSGETGKVYTAIDTGKIYRWSGTVYVEISPSPGSTDAVPEGVTNLYYTEGRVTANSSVSANTAARHSHPNKALLDTYAETQANLSSAVSLKHAALTLGTPNGLSLATQQLSMSAASLSDIGTVTTGAQSFAGNKTFTGTVTAAFFSGNGASVTDITPVNVKIKGAKVYRSTDTALIGATPTVISFDTEQLDTSGYYNPGTSTSRLVVPAGLAGWYMVGASLKTGVGNPGARVLSVHVNGVPVCKASCISDGNGREAWLSASSLVSLAVGDYVELFFMSTSVSVIVDAETDYSPTLWMTLQGTT